MVRPLHPAGAGHPRRQDRRPGAARARGAVLHAPHPHRRRAAQQHPAAGDRRDRNRVRSRRRRRHRPPEHPAALDPHRGRTGDLGAARGRRTRHDGGLRRRPSSHRRMPTSRGRCRRGAGRRARHRAGRRALSRRPGLREPAPQVQDQHQRLLGALHQPRDQRPRAGRRRAPRARPGLRPVGRRWSVDQPQAGPSPRRLRRTQPGRGGLGGRHQHLPRLWLPSLAQPRPPEVPACRLGCGEVPPGPRGRVPDGPAARRAGPRRTRDTRSGPRRRPRPEGRPVVRRDRRPGGPHQRHPAAARRRAGRTARRRAGLNDRAAGAGRAGRPCRAPRGAGRGARVARPAGPAVSVQAGNARLYRP